MGLFSGFRGVLGLLKKGNEEEKMSMLLSVGTSMDLPAQAFKDLASWLTECTSAGKWNEAVWGKAWIPLFNFIKTRESWFVECCSEDAGYKDAIGEFLTEALRVCNFTRHDPDLVRYFISLFQKCGIVVAGDAEKCAELATFGGLGYDVASHTVTMLDRQFLVGTPTG